MSDDLFLTTAQERERAEALMDEFLAVTSYDREPKPEEYFKRLKASDDEDD